MDSLQKTANVLSNFSPSVQGPSKSFQILVRAIGEAKTKHEEDRIIRREAIILKEKMSSRETTQRQMREYLIRMLYCEMLGVACPWGHIHAVTFTQKTNLIDKRVGYLVCSLILHPDHELNMLLVNSIQRDLRSANMLEVSMALIIVSRLVGPEMIPAVLPLVREKLHHPKELVRKKALLALHHFYGCSASSIDHLQDDIRKGLSDPDPGVMEAALILLHDVIQDNPSHHKDLTGAFLSILSQVVGRRLPSEFDYHGVPSPWIQMRLLRILAILGTDDSKVSEEIYPHLENTLACAESNSNVGQAITYECIRTITAIYPQPAIIKKAAAAISRFLSNQNNNWKYLGVTALAALVQVDPKYALDYQLMVIDCLDDPDETLKRKTLDLLYKMTNPANVKVISEKLLSYLRSTTNKFIKADLVSKITQLAERFSPDNEWFIETMNAVFEVGGEYVRKEVAFNLMRLIAEGTEDEDIDRELRTNAVISYLQLLSKPNLPDVMVKIICWVIGEYAYVKEDIDLENVLEMLTALLNHDFQDVHTRSWIINSITRLVAQLGYLPEVIHTQIALYLTSVDTDVQQRSSELLEFTQNLNLMQEVLPLDSSCEDLEVDSSLSFLDAHVSKALVDGAAPYKPAQLRDLPEKTENASQQQSGIKFEPYAEPVKPFSHQRNIIPEKAPSFDKTSSDPPSTSDQPSLLKAPSVDKSEFITDVVPAPSPDLSEGIKVKGDRKWGKEGYKKLTRSQISDSSVSQSTEESQTIGTGSINDGITLSSDNTDNNIVDTKSNTKISTIEAKPRLTPEQKRKSEFASALFTGLSKQSSAGSTARIKSDISSSKREEIVPKDIQKKTHKPLTEDLLLDLGTMSVTDDSTNDNDDLVRVSEPSSTTLDPLAEYFAQTSSQSERTSKPSKDDLIGLFDSPLESTLSTATTESHSSLGVSLIDSAVLSSGQPLQVSTPSLTPSSTVMSITHGHPVVSGWDKQEISRDAKMCIMATKVARPDNLVLVLYLSNHSQISLTGVSITVTLPSMIKEYMSADSSEGLPGLTWKGDIEGFETFPYVLGLLPTSLSSVQSLKGELSYLSQRMFFDLKLNPTDFIRPMEISEKQFGQKWKNVHSEKKIKISSHSLKTTSDFMNMMSTHFNLYPVKIIGSEGICCGVYLPDTVCLVHGKVQTQSLEIWIKTQTSSLTDALVKQFQTTKF